METEATNIWSFTEEAANDPTVDSVADLWHWSTNYDAGCGPFALFLDIIGWSDEQLGEPLYGPTAKLKHGDVPNRIADDNWDQYLGYLEIGKLADALNEYAERPQDVRAWVDRLMQFDEA